MQLWLCVVCASIVVSRQSADTRYVCAHEFECVWQSAPFSMVRRSNLYTYYGRISDSRRQWRRRQRSRCLWIETCITYFILSMCTYMCANIQTISFFRPFLQFLFFFFNFSFLLYRQLKQRQTSWSNILHTNECDSQLHARRSVELKRQARKEEKKTQNVKLEYCRCYWPPVVVGISLLRIAIGSVCVCVRSLLCMICMLYRYAPVQPVLITIIIYARLRRPGVDSTY